MLSLTLRRRLRSGGFLLSTHEVAQKVMLKSHSLIKAALLPFFFLIRLQIGNGGKSREGILEIRVISVRLILRGRILLMVFLLERTYLLWVPWFRGLTPQLDFLAHPRIVTIGAPSSNSTEFGASASTGGGRWPQRRCRGIFGQRPRSGNGRAEYGRCNVDS